jgi:hypothetical protein
MFLAGPAKIVGSSYLRRHWNPGWNHSIGFTIPLTDLVFLRPTFSYHELHPKWEVLPIGPHN